SKIDSFLDEFASELTLLKSIPSGIDDTDCHPENEIRLTKRLLYDNSSPRPPKEFVSENSNADIKSFSPSPIPVKDSDSSIVITFDLPTVEPEDSLRMEDEHLDTILETKSDEFIKSSVENLVPSPSESEDDSEYDVPACDDFTTFSNLLFDADDDFSSSYNESFCDEDISKEIYSNPLFDEEIISMKIDLHHFNAESDLIESLLNHDSLITSSSLKIDSLLDEFAGELILLKSIPPRIDETDCDLEEEIHLIEILLYDNSSPRPPEEFISENSNAAIESFSPSPIRVEDSDSFMEEIDLSLTPDDSMPPSLHNEDFSEKIFSNPLFEEEIISIKKNQHHFNAESDLVESMLNHDSSIISSSSKINSLLDEFAGELTLLKSIPTGIDKTDCHLENEIRFSERLLYDNSSPRPPEEFNPENSNAEIESFSPSPIPNKDSDSFMEEIDLFLNPDDPMPPSIEDDEDFEGDILFLERLLHDDPIPLPDTLDVDFSYEVRIFLPFFTYPVKGNQEKEKIGMKPDKNGKHFKFKKGGKPAEHLPPSKPFVLPSRTDWDLLFELLFDELLTPPPSVDHLAPKVIAPITEVVALEPATSIGLPSSTTVDQDAPSPNVAHMINDPFFSDGESPKTPTFHDDPLHESLHEDSASQGSSSNMRQTHTPFESLGRWTKDSPIANGISDSSCFVSTRKQL
nr:hypothetical protein [Tanacetum cinerariifolium]